MKHLHSVGDFTLSLGTRKPARKLLMVSSKNLLFPRPGGCLKRFSGRSFLLSPLMALTLGVGLSGSAAAADPIPYVFKNDTGMSSSQIFIQFMNASSTVTGTYSNVFGVNQQLQANTAYSLDQITGADGIAKVNVTDFSGGRIFVNFGPYGLQGMGPGYTPAAQTPTDPNYSTRYQYFEQTIVPQGSGTAVYTDLSYIDFTAISLSMSAQYSSNGTVNRNVQNANQISANTQLLVNAAFAQSGTNTVAPVYPPNPTPPNPTANPAAIIPGGASPTLPNADFARVISPQFSAEGVYHDFTAYLTSLTANSTTVHLAGTYVGTGTQPTGNISTQGQTYDFTGTFSGNLTTGGITLTAGPLSGNAGVSWLGNSTASGVGSNATIYIPYSSLNSQDGIYGNNGNYAITSPGYSTNQVGISNDVWGQVVGDLYAGLSFGYVGSTTAFGNSTIGALASSQWWASGESNAGGTTLANGTPNGQQILYANTPAGQKLYFSGVQSNPLFYNGYAASLTGGNQSLTTGYGFPLQDRLGNNLLYYNTTGNGMAGTQVVLTINPDGAAALPTAIWTANASGSWGSNSSWSGGIVPAGNASVQFVGNPNATITVDTGTNRSAAGIFFNFAAGNFTIANNTITLTGDIVNSSNKTQTINSNLTLGSNSTVTAAFGDLAFGGAIALKNSAAPNTLTFSGTQNSTVSGIISDGNSTGTGGSLAKNGSGTLTLSGNNTFSGGVTHQAGTLVLGADQAGGTGTLLLGKAGGADAVLQSSGAGRTLANSLAIAGNTTFSGSNGFIFTGTATLTGSTIPQGNGTVTIKKFRATNSVAVEFAGPIGESTSGSSFTKAGSGTMTFSGNAANTFTGGLKVIEGTLGLNKSSGVAYGGNLTIGDNSGPANSAVVRLQANNQTPGTGVTIGTDGELDLQTFNVSVGNLTMTGGSVIGSGTLSLASGSMVQFTGSGNSSATIASGVALTGSTTFDIGQNAAATQMSITGSLSGNASLTKDGSGNLALLGGNNTNTGSVTISGGTLQATSMNVDVSINGGAISPGAVGNITAISVANLYASSGNKTGAFLMDLGSGNSSDSINVAGITNLGNATTFLFKDASITNAPATFTLVTGNLTSWQAPLATAPAFSFASIDIAGLTGTFAYANGTLTFTAQAGVTNTWSGATDGNWTTGSNWSGNSVPLTGADLIFTGSTPTVSTGTDRTTGAITFAAGTSAMTITGNTIILGGNLSNNSSNTQTVNSAIALNANRAIFANSGNLVLGGSVALSNNGAIPGTLTVSGNVSLTGNLSDGPAAGGSLVKIGTGTLALSGNNSAMNGPVTISSGVVSANSNAALGSGAGGVGSNQGPNSLIFNGGTLQATGDIISSQHRYLFMESTGIIDTNSQNVTINGLIVGAGGLTKIGNGSLTLSQATTDINTYSGVTTIANGSLVITAGTVLGGTANGTVVQSGASLVIANTFNVTGESLTLDGSGDAGRGALRLLSGQISTWNGTVGLTGNASIQAGDSASLTLSQAVNVGNFTLTIGGNSSSAAPTETLPGGLSGSGGLTKTGNGTVSLSGDGTGYSGATAVQAGILNVIGATALGNGTSAVIVASGATLQLQSQTQSQSQIPAQGQQTFFASLSLSGTGIVVGSSNQGAINNNTSYANTVGGNVILFSDALVNSTSGLLTLSGNIDLGSHTLSTASNSVPITLTGNISGTGGITTITTGSGGLVLTGNNTYSGGTTVANNTYLTVASNHALGSGNTTITSGGALQFQGGINMATGNLSVGGVGYNASGALLNISGNNTYAGGITLTSQTTLASNNGTLSLTGALAGAGNNLIIQGPGTVYVAGAVSNVALVNISSGTFASGNMSTTQVNVGPFAGPGIGTPTFSPGNINKSETVNVSNLITSGNATLLMDLGATGVSDQIVTANAPSLGSGISFIFNNNGFSGSGNYTLVTASSGGIGGGVPVDQLTFVSNISGLSGTFSYPNGQNLQFLASSSSAVWNDGAGNGQWGSNGNWALGATPAGGSAVSFTSSNATTIDTQTNRLAGGITFEAGSNALTIGNNTVAVYGQILNNSTAIQTINSAVSLAGNVNVNAAAGNLAINGPVNFGNGTAAGTLTFTGGNNTTVSGAISGTASTLVKTGTGSLILTGNNTFTGTTSVNGGFLVINGSLAIGNSLTVGSNGTLAGSGNVGGDVTVAGTLSPGNSPGALSTGSEVWTNGGGFNWQLYNATGTAGVAYDTISITGGLDLTALTSGNFSINLWTLSAVGPDSNGNAINFVNTSNYTWTLVSTTSGITGFSAGNFAINVGANNGTTGFSNPLAGGAFSVSVSGNDLQLNYTAIPEPSIWALLLGSCVALSLLRRRVRRRPRWNAESPFDP
jgi:fibronectin-binding autotransporter adhesin